MSPRSEVVAGRSFGHPHKHRQHDLMIEVPDRYLPDRESIVSPARASMNFSRPQRLPSQGFCYRKAGM